MALGIVFNGHEMHTARSIWQIGESSMGNAAWTIDPGQFIQLNQFEVFCGWHDSKKFGNDTRI